VRKVNGVQNPGQATTGDPRPNLNHIIALRTENVFVLGLPETGD
jgi:hypothetical protein